LEISGPFALFQNTRLYGHALGELIPLLAWCARFRLQADFVLDGRRVALELATGDPIFLRVRPDSTTAASMSASLASSD